MVQKNLEKNKFTQARIGLERAGHSISTKELLNFQISHAQAKDAVYGKWDINITQNHLNNNSVKNIVVHSQTNSRDEYLVKPHLGCVLENKSIQILSEEADKNFDIVFCISDGLSAIAIENHFIPFWETFYNSFKDHNFKIAPLILVPYGRVAISDHIGEVLTAKITVIFIGERPGLTSPDSMGIYLTYSPSSHNNNSNRNCISNIRPPYGLSYLEASKNLKFLIEESMKRNYSGVNLKAPNFSSIENHKNEPVLSITQK